MRDNINISSLFTKDGFNKAKFITKATESFQKRITARADFIEKAYAILDETQKEIDDQIIHNITDEIIFCDFKLFIIVVKNLIDNGIKYSTDNKIKIIANPNSIEFLNHSSPLKHDFKYYLEPFFKGELKPMNKDGFGLGLYITSKIIKSHGYTLAYSHKNGNNIFTISMN